MKRFRTREGGIVEHGRVVGKGGSLVEHVILSTELELEAAASGNGAAALN